jgi:hypothetical protein
MMHTILYNHTFSINLEMVWHISCSLWVIMRLSSLWWKQRRELTDNFLNRNICQKKKDHFPFLLKKHSSWPKHYRAQWSYLSKKITDVDFTRRHQHTVCGHAVKLKHTVLYPPGLAWTWRTRRRGPDTGSLSLCSPSFPRQTPLWAEQGQRYMCERRTV